VPIPERPTVGTADARWQCRLTDDGSPTLVQMSTNDSMHSGCGAVAETRHVYLVGSGVAERLAQHQPTRVLELGFGSGLGWLMTADEATAYGTPLFYHALESQLPPADVIRQLHWERHIRNAKLVDATIHGLELVELSLASQTPITPLRFEQATLELSCGDAVQWCLGSAHEIYQLPPNRFDAVYFDPFSPATSPRLWQPDIFTAMREVTAPDGRLASYCVNRQVRDALQVAQWVVTKVTGPPGGKREVLVARPA
jgi:tRNA U34 5-methylaminomethyl-2-thiouridine-forming methyltransferase MnmC